MANNSTNNNDQPRNSQNPGEIVPAPQNLAANFIRSKINDLYSTEPDATEEEAEAIKSTHRSKHQQFMYELTTSGKDLVQIQTEWHNYYLSLSSEDKKQVWQEFYDSNKNAVKKAQEIKEAPIEQKAQVITAHINQRAVGPKKPKSTFTQKTARTKNQATPKLTWKHHLQSALFGLSMGAVVVFILLFGFFNEVLIAPFIQPSRNVTATPIILSANTVAPSKTPEVIIPKINVQIPVNYTTKTTNEYVIENDLESGVVHYPTTSFPGQTGNAAYFGHSANNILNPGRYKFAFVLLHDLVPGDVFYLTYNDKVYAYKVFSTTIVNPNDVSVLNPIPGHIATATLITCDPPGTSINRLVVVGNQISPNPNGNTAPTPTVTTTTQVNRLPGNGPSLWHRFISSLLGKIISAIFVISVIGLIWRWYNNEFRKKSTN